MKGKPSVCKGGFVGLYMGAVSMVYRYITRRRFLCTQCVMGGGLGGDSRFGNGRIESCLQGGEVCHKWRRKIHRGENYLLPEATVVKP